MYKKKYLKYKKKYLNLVGGATAAIAGTKGSTADQRVIELQKQITQIQTKQKQVAQQKTELVKVRNDIQRELAQVNFEISAETKRATSSKSNLPELNKRTNEYLEFLQKHFQVPSNGDRAQNIKSMVVEIAKGVQFNEILTQLKTKSTQINEKLAGVVMEINKTDKMMDGLTTELTPLTDQLSQIAESLVALRQVVAPEAAIDPVLKCRQYTMEKCEQDPKCQLYGLSKTDKAFCSQKGKYTHVQLNTLDDKLSGTGSMFSSLTGMFASSESEIENDYKAYNTLHGDQGNYWDYIEQEDTTVDDSDEA